MMTSFGDGVLEGYTKTDVMDYRFGSPIISLV